MPSPAGIDGGTPSRAGTTAIRRAIQTLDGIRLLAELPAADRVELARRCVWRRPAAGEEVIRLGSASSEALLVVEGQLQVVYFAPSGREIAYAEIAAGGHVGELGLLDGGVRSASVVAGKGCYLAIMPKPLFEDMLARHPVIARRLLADLASIIRATNRKLTEFGLIPAMPRVYRELLRLADPGDGETLVINSLPTQGDLAARAGTTRETVARALAQLAKNGIAERHGRRLIVSDPASLAALASLPEMSGTLPKV